MQKILEPQKKPRRYKLHREKQILTKRIKRRFALEEYTKSSLSSLCAKNTGTTEDTEALRAAQRKTNTHKEAKRRFALEEETNWLNLYLIVFSFTSLCAKSIGTIEYIEALRAAQRKTNTHKEA